VTAASLKQHPGFRHFDEMHAFAPGEFQPFASSEQRYRALDRETIAGLAVVSARVPRHQDTDRVEFEAWGGDLDA
jgi:hypothetical protein